MKNVETVFDCCFVIDPVSEKITGVSWKCSIAGENRTERFVIL